MDEDDGRPGGLTEQYGHPDARQDALPLSLCSARLAHPRHQLATGVRREEVGWSSRSGKCQGKPFIPGACLPTSPSAFPAPSAQNPSTTARNPDSYRPPSFHSHSVPQHQGEAA